MTRPFYDTDDVPFRAKGPTTSGWGLLAPQVFGIAHYQPPTALSARPVCAETDPDLFFPEKDLGASWMAQRAKRLCADCLIKAECLALGLHEEHGIWGGTTPRQRRRMRVDAGLPDELIEVAS